MRPQLTCSVIHSDSALCGLVASLPLRPVLVILTTTPPASHRTLTFHSVCFPFLLYGIEIVQKAMMIRTADCRSAILTTSIKPGSKVPTCLISGAGRAADKGGPAVYLILFVRGSDTGRSLIVSHPRSCRRASHTAPLCTLLFTFTALVVTGQSKLDCQPPFPYLDHTAQSGI